MRKRYIMNIPIQIIYDNEANVYIAENEEIGLVLESGSFDRLVERLRSAVPEMAQANGIECTGLDVSSRFHQAVVG